MLGELMMLVTAHKPIIEIRELHEQVLSFNIIDTKTNLSTYNLNHSIRVVMIGLPWEELERVRQLRVDNIE